MLPQVRTTSDASGGTQNSAPAVFDILRDPFAVGFGVEVTGTATYTIQHTFDDIINLGAAGCVWFPHDDANLVNATANQNSNFAYPVTAARVQQTAGNGSVRAVFIQAGLRGA